MNNQRKKQIIDTAAKLFREKGYNAVTMRDLAEELGIKASSIYNHIPSKQEILAEIVMDLVKDFTLHIQGVEEQQGTSIEKINLIIQMHVRTTIHKTDFLACMNKEWKNLEESKQTVYVKLRNQYEKNFYKIIVSGIEKGEIASRNPEIIVFSILSTLRTLYHWYSNRTYLNEEELVHNLQENMLEGIICR